jgi:uncharacterized repeat protein (TIGR01451 family)
MLIKQQLRRVRLAVVALGLIGVAPSVFAAGSDTNSGTPITNTASVNYSVSGVAQTVIQSSPTGNSNPGVGNGTATSFLVDKRIMFIAEETDGAATVTSPTLTGVVTVFRVTNTSNGAQDFRIAADNNQPPAAIFGRADAFDMQNFTLHISTAACSTATMATPAFIGGATEPATTFIPALAEDSCKYVFVRSDPVTTPAPPLNGTASTIRLVVTATTTGSLGVTNETQSGVADNPAAVDVVFAETGTANGNVANNGVSLAFDQYLVGTLTVTKTATVISDPISAAGQYKAIPGAVVEYTISVQNSGLVTSGAALTELIPTNTAYVAGSTTLNGVARADVSGAMPFVGGGSINSPSAAAGVINPGSTAAEIAVVRFRVTIN